MEEQFQLQFNLHFFYVIYAISSLTYTHNYNLFFAWLLYFKCVHILSYGTKLHLDKRPITVGLGINKILLQDIIH